MPGNHRDTGDGTTPRARSRADWRAASTRVGSVETGRRGLRGPKPGRPVPQGVIHAYAIGDEHTACGEPLDTLHRWEDELFGRLLNGCPRCQALVRVNPDVIDLTAFDNPRGEDADVPPDHDRERSSTEWRFP